MSTFTPDLRNSQLFLDDSMIEDHIRVQRVWHQPTKYLEPVMTPAFEWEGWCPCLYGTVLRIDGTFRMWYVGTRNSSRPVICYAESGDGVHWERPELGLCEFGGNKKNNIVIKSELPKGFIDDCAMIYEPDDADWPYKLMYWDSLDVNPKNFGIFVSKSKDGIHFESMGNVLQSWDDRFVAVSEKVDGKYRVYARGNLLSSMDENGNWKGQPWLTEQSLGEFPRKRPVIYTESEDLINWTPGEHIIKMSTDDPYQMQIYSLTPFRYEGIWLAGLLRMHTVPDVLDPELVWSYDGKTWHRSIHRDAFIPLGPKGSFDSTWLNLATNPPILNFHQLWFYYSGRSGPHGALFPEAYGAIGLATLRVDGFCSMWSCDHPGAILTKPMTWVGGDLLLNVDPRRDISGHHTGGLSKVGGMVSVEIHDEQNNPIEGFRFADCNPIEKNTRNFDEEPEWTEPDRDTIGVNPVTWKNGRSAKELAGKRIRLFFEIQDAHLYSFRASTG